MKPTIDCFCNGSNNTENDDISRKCRFLKILVRNRVRNDSMFLSFEATLKAVAFQLTVSSKHGMY